MLMRKSSIEMRDIMKGLAKKEKSRISRYLFSIIICIAIIAILAAGVFYVGRISNKQNLDLTRQSVIRATLQCYAIEGVYPPELEYLEDNYGLMVNKDKFYVEYNCFASNIMPAIEVYERY